MGALAAGEVVLVPFPFSDLSTTKVRPAVCLAVVGRADSILCQITSQGYRKADCSSQALFGRVNCSLRIALWFSDRWAVSMIPHFTAYSTPSQSYYSFRRHEMKN